MQYTRTVNYISNPEVFSEGEHAFDISRTGRVRIDPDNPVYRRACEVFTQRGYMYPAPPLFLGTFDLTPPEEAVYTLRLLIKMQGTGYVIPRKLLFLEDYIRYCAEYQQDFFPAYEERFVYLTVRHGPMLTSREDEFHGDGFQGVSVPRHIPEQNYLWACSYPTLFSMQPYFVEDLDPAKHNLHSYFDRHTDRRFLYTGVEKGIYVIDPYHVHARQKIAEGTRRTVLRLTFSPVEIRDDTSTVNPWMPRGPYNRGDPRNHLWEYPGREPELKFGLRRFTPASPP